MGNAKKNQQRQGNLKISFLPPLFFFAYVCRLSFANLLLHRLVLCLLLVDFFLYLFLLLPPLLFFLLLLLLRFSCSSLFSLSPPIPSSLSLSSSVLDNDRVVHIEDIPASRTLNLSLGVYPVVTRAVDPSGNVRFCLGLVACPYWPAPCLYSPSFLFVSLSFLFFFFFFFSCFSFFFFFVNKIGWRVQLHNSRVGFNTTHGQQRRWN